LVLSPEDQGRLTWVEQLDGPVAVAYEAGPTGFGLYRALTAAGIRCVVAAPSKLQRPSGDRVKTDAKDAVHLARLLRLGEITPVTVPSVDQEAAGDLVRAREDCRGDLMRGPAPALETAAPTRDHLLRRSSVDRSARSLAAPAAVRSTDHQEGVRV
jgi:hypothetical protein